VLPDTTAERFWPKVEKGDGCWEWTGAKRRGGYGHLFPNLVAHRVAYQLVVGAIPDGLSLDHLCRNRGCVNPAHLEPVSTRENLMRSPLTIATRNVLKGQCPKGHPYTAANSVAHSKNGGRQCRQCKNDWARGYRRRNAA
jgi:hypothetical protein